jgi:hypothetical protein
MLGITTSLFAILAFLAFAEWRSAPVWCLIAALLQDPLRKLTPDQPVFFVGLVGIVFGAACLGAWAQGVPFTPGSMFARDRKIAATMYLLLLLIVLEALNSFLQFHNPMITSIGLLSYLLPLPSMIFAYQLVVRGGEVRIHQFIMAYLYCTMLALTTIYLEYTGYDWAIFGQVGGNLPIYDKFSAGMLIPHSGIFRASEIAAWHAMTCACFALLVITLRKFNFLTLLSAAIVVTVLISIAILTGRRKAVVEVAVFVSTYCVLWFILQKKVEKMGSLFAIFALIGFGWLATQLGDAPLFPDEKTLSYYSYVERSKTAFEEAPERFVELGIAPIMWAYEGFGLFGAGLGAATQGVQHFGGGGDMTSAGEGGLGRITLELGIPGLVATVWFAVLVFMYLWRIMRDASEVSPRIAGLSYGLFSFLVANIAGFSVATQAYSDIFILLILSWVLGFLLAVPVLLEREALARQPAVFVNPAQALRPSRP